MIELRPQWCLDDSDVAKSVEFGPWLDADGNDVFSLNGDDWRPGDVVRVQRSISVDGDAIELRRALGLPTGLRVSVGVRWFCRATGRAGVHEQGPAPLALLEANLLEVALPREIARTVELETCLIGFWDAGQERNDLCPNGALMWSDGWEAPPSDREILLEGSQLRIPVSTVSFKERFEGTSSALWFIELDVGIEPDHLVSNAVGVLLNADVLERDFKVVRERQTQASYQARSSPEFRWTSSGCSPERSKSSWLKWASGKNVATVQSAPSFAIVSSKVSTR